MSEHRWPAPTWAQIGTVAQFVLVRLNEAHDTLAPRGSARQELEQIVAEETRVHELSSGPVARYRRPDEPAHRAEDDSERRRVNFAALVKIATAFSLHSDFDTDWVAEPRGRYGPTADCGGDKI